METLVGHGYAAISFDWTGPREQREHVTRWPEAGIRYSAVAPDEAYMVRAVTAARQCLSLLAAHPRVDGERLGEFGISWGGYQTWLLNAVDDRLKAAIAIYGCGITPGQARFYFRDEVKQSGSFDETRWFKLFHPANYARCQHAPVLYINGTNDFFGWMNSYRQLAGKLDGRHRCAFAPHCNHAVATLNPTLLAWLDHHLRGRAFPEAPQLEVAQRSAGLVLRSPQLPGAASADFFVAAENGVGPDYFWQPLPAVLKNGIFTARLPAAAITSVKTMVYAHQRLADGVEISSVPVCTNRLVNSAARVRRIRAAEHFPLTPDLWYGGAPVDPFYPYVPLPTVGDGPGMESSVNDGDSRTYQFNTRLVGAARFRPLPGDRFYCRLEGPVQEPVTVALLRYAGSPRERHYHADCSMAALARGIHLHELKDAGGQGLRSAAGLSHLYIGGKMTKVGLVRLVAAGWRR